MTKAQLDRLESGEAQAIVDWRFDQLVRAGYGAQDASALAEEVEIDLHLAERLLAKGCPPETAVRILR